ncbi:MAG: DNA polymerase III subunit alpha [Gammaproteobacteria bacterium]
MTAAFAHLRLHTEYSLVDSVVRVDDLVAAAAAKGMPAVAVTDQNNLFSMVKFYKAALGAGIKPIIGVDLLVRETGDRAQPSRLTLLCQSPSGYGNVTRLVSRAYLEGQQRGVATIDRTWLTTENISGLIAISCATEGDVGRALVNGKERDADQALSRWLELFGDRFYIELQRLGRPGEEPYIASAVSLASKRGVPVVATNDVRFIKPDDFESHEARVCINDGALLVDQSRARKYTNQQYLRTPKEMAELFSDIPEALSNSVEVARRCSLVLKLGESRLPAYPVPEGETANSFIRGESARGLTDRLERLKVKDPERYHERLEIELTVICQMGFSGYFLIVADFIRWARNNGVPVGPGRGSGAGSLVAYCLGITDIDPLAYDLLFERFLNPERVSMPDFDVDFCMEGRDRVIDYVADKYGRERVSQIITYGTMAAKAVVRDCGRVLGMSYGFVDRIAKLVPFELGITLDDALEKEPELKKLYDTEEEIKNLIDLARSLEGLTRNAGKHAGGVVIAPSVLTDFAPLYCEEGAKNVVTQFDKDDVEASGLVKFDFLGLRTLTIIDWAVKIMDRVRASKGLPPFDINAIPMEDEKSYTLLKACKTTAVFQLESRGMKDLIRRLQPDCFEDIVALVALFRPGPLQSGMVDDFIERKHSKNKATQEPIDYLHPDLKPVLYPTYGVILYQEQVMQIAQVLAGYTLGGADMLRRAMGKKKPEEMATQRQIFLDGSTKRGVDARQAGNIFDLMEKFAGYGFNKSHSAAYALLSYQTAFLKAHYPAAFMAAVMSADMAHTDKVVTLIRDCRDSCGLEVKPPDVNVSRFEFTVDDDKTIRYGLGAVRGVGQGVVEAIIEEREAHGRFTSIENLCRRLDLSKLNRRVLEALIRSGSLDSLGSNRATMMQRLPAAMQLGDQNSKALDAGQNDMFGLATADRSKEVDVLQNVPTLLEWSERVRRDGERDTLGLYLTGHPMDPFESGIARFVTHRLEDLVSERPSGGGGEGGFRFGGGKPVTVAGEINEIKKRGPRTMVTLDDGTGWLEVTLFEDAFQLYRDLIAKNSLVIVEGLLRFDDFSDGWRLTAKKVKALEKAREEQAKRLVLRWPQGQEPAQCSNRLAEILRPYRGGPCAITVEYRGRGAAGALTLGSDWNVKATRELIEKLETFVGDAGLRVVYGAPSGSASAH